MAAYGVDVLSPDVSLRRVRVLAERLPPHARRGGDQWSTEAELLALLVDHVAQLTWVTLRAAGAKNARRPPPLPRPPGRAGNPRAAEPQPPGRRPGRAANWLEAAGQLAAIPGVIVEEPDG
jgi:hypothetical protein